MPGNSDTLSITLKLGGQILPMTIDRKDELYYREAEKLINQRFNYYANTYPSPQLGNEMYLTMTVLEIAVQLKSIEGEANQLTDNLKNLVADVEAALEQK